MKGKKPKWAIYSWIGFSESPKRWLVCWWPVGVDQWNNYLTACKQCEMWSTLSPLLPPFFIERVSCCNGSTGAGSREIWLNGCLESWPCLNMVQLSALIKEISFLLKKFWPCCICVLVSFGFGCGWIGGCVSLCEHSVYR